MPLLKPLQLVLFSSFFAIVLLSHVPHMTGARAPAASAKSKAPPAQKFQPSSSAQTPSGPAKVESVTTVPASSSSSIYTPVSCSVHSFVPFSCIFLILILNWAVTIRFHRVSFAAADSWKLGWFWLWCTALRSIPPCSIGHIISRVLYQIYPQTQHFLESLVSIWWFFATNFSQDCKFITFIPTGGIKIERFMRRSSFLFASQDASTWKSELSSMFNLKCRYTFIDFKIHPENGACCWWFCFQELLLWLITSALELTKSISSIWCSSFNRQFYPLIFIISAGLEWPLRFRNGDALVYLFGLFVFCHHVSLRYSGPCRLPW
jgi:hypothetical protein